MGNQSHFPFVGNQSRFLFVRNQIHFLFVRNQMWVSRFKYRIKVARGRFKLVATPCPTHVGGHLDQPWNSEKSYLSILVRVKDTFLK